MRRFKEKPHTQLRLLLDCYGVRGSDVAAWLGREDHYVYTRMVAKMPWTIADIYIIADNLNRIDPDSPPLPYHKIAEYFPPGGLRLREGERPAVS